MKKRVISFLLAVLCSISLLYVPADAADGPRIDLVKEGSLVFLVAKNCEGMTSFDFEIKTEPDGLITSWVFAEDDNFFRQVGNTYAFESNGTLLSGYFQECLWDAETYADAALEAGVSVPAAFSADAFRLAELRIAPTTDRNARLTVTGELVGSFGKKKAEATVSLYEAPHQHTWDKGTVTEAPTCVKTGVRVFACTVCGETRNETVPATGKHTPGKGVETVLTPADCGHAGEQKTTVTCTVCGEILSETKQEIPATGKHTPGKPVETVLTPADCGKAGEKKTTVTCAVCGEILSETKQEIPATGKHTPGKPVETVLTPADRMHAGEEKITVTCTVCGVVLSETKREIPALGPIPGDVNGDGVVLANDARLALRAAVGLDDTAEGLDFSNPENRCYVAADVDGKAGISASDARLILRAAVGLEILLA